MHLSIGKQAVILAFDSKAEIDLFLTTVGEWMESNDQKSADIIRKSDVFGETN